MPILENLRHETFAQELSKGISQRKAYREAFPNSKKWKDSTVDSKASTLAKHEKVLGRLQELQGKLEKRSLMTGEERIRWLEDVVVNGEQTVTIKGEVQKLPVDIRDRLRAMDILNKMQGAYTENVNVSGNTGVMIVNDIPRTKSSKSN